MLRKNTASQFIYFSGVNATTGAALTGATFSVRRSIDGTFAAGGGTITEDTGLGFYKCALTQADTNGNDLAFFFTATNAIPVCINVLTTAADPSDTVRYGLTALPNATAGASGGALISGSNSGTTTFGALTVTGATTYTGNVVYSDGITVSVPSTTDRPGVSFKGNGAGAGMFCFGGPTGHGADFAGGATSGQGISARASTLGNGIYASGAAGAGMLLAAGGTNTHGLSVTGAGTGHGILATGGSGATGDGIQAVSASTNGNGLKLTKTGTGLALSGATTDLTLAKTTNITGFNDIAATSVVSSGAITTSGGAVSTVTSVTNAVAITSNVKKNQALAKVEFLITDSTNHNPKTSAASIVATRSIDGGAFAAGTLSAVTEVSNGIYYVDFGAGDLNGNVITLRVTSTSNDDVFLTLITAP